MDGNPGCAPRPRALICNRFAVGTIAALSARDRLQDTRNGNVGTSWGNRMTLIASQNGDGCQGRLASPCSAGIGGQAAGCHWLASALPFEPCGPAPPEACGLHWRRSGIAATVPTAARCFDPGTTASPGTTGLPVLFSGSSDSRMRESSARDFQGMSAVLSAPKGRDI